MKQLQRRTAPDSIRQHQTHLMSRGPIQEQDVLRPNSTSLLSAVKPTPRRPIWNSPQHLECCIFQRAAVT